MMFKPKKAMTLLALAGIALASTAVNSAANTTFSTDDLILGIRQDSTSGSQSPSALLIDLGQASQFTAGNNISSVSLGSGFATLMTNTFGSGWATDGTVHWGIVGTSGVAGASGNDTDPNILYATSTSSTAYTVGSDAAQGVTRSKITSMDSTFNNKTLATGTTNGMLQALTASNGWGVNNTSTGNNGTSFSSFSNMEANFSTGTPSTMNLYRMDDGGGTNTGNAGQTIGSFSFNSSGNLSFTANVAAAPEPARVAFLGLGLGALFLRRRRR
jgi:hypothetical protein